MENVNLEQPASTHTVSKLQSMLSTQQSLSREKNEYVSTATHSSTKNKVDLPFRAGGEDCDDLIGYETTRRCPMKIASKWNRAKIVILILIISLIIVIGFWCASFFQTNCRLNKC
jgi:hypothetical protein